MKDPTADEVDAHVARIGEAIRKTLDCYVGRTEVTKELLASICEILRRANPHPDDDHLRFTVGETPDSVVPANLYTAMRMMYGDHAPSWSVCEGGAWTAPDGTGYEWRDGVTYVTVTQPLSVIEITLKVEGDEKHG